MFSNLEKLTIPEGEVVKITAGGVTLWERTGSLPSAYQRVEWVRAEASYAGDNNGSYIKLGFTFDTVARFKIGFYAESTTTTYLFGAAENSGALRCMISAPYGGGWAGTLYGSKGSQFAGVNIKVVNGLNEWECTMEKGLIRASNLTNGETVSDPTQGSYTMTNELYLLGQNYNGTPRFGSARKVAFFDYYDKNDELICSLTPCYRKSDGVIGMYDTVRRLFLTNAGSGSFTKGADVTGYNNLAEPLPDNTTDTTKWVNGYRFSSSGISAQSGTTLSNKIPCKSGDVIRIKGVTLRDNADRVGVHREGYGNIYTVGYFNVGVTISQTAVITYNGLIDGAYTFTVSNWPGNVIDGFRFAMPTPADASNVIVTVNQAIPR